VGDDEELGHLHEEGHDSADADLEMISRFSFGGKVFGHFLKF
jgi:hypothetical protein